MRCSGRCVLVRPLLLYGLQLRSYSAPCTQVCECTARLSLSSSAELSSTETQSSSSFELLACFSLLLDGPRKVLTLKFKSKFRLHLAAGLARRAPPRRRSSAAVRRAIYRWPSGRQPEPPDFRRQGRKNPQKQSRFPIVDHARLCSP